ncbi:MAG: hypothetical protein ACI91J_003688 [Yoonia sp.]|jgi:hypothetical protein
MDCATASWTAAVLCRFALCSHVPEWWIGKTGASGERSGNRIRFAIQRFWTHQSWDGTFFARCHPPIPVRLRRLPSGRRRYSKCVAGSRSNAKTLVELGDFLHARAGKTEVVRGALASWGSHVFLNLGSSGDCNAGTNPWLTRSGTWQGTSIPRPLFLDCAVRASCLMHIPH